MDSLVTQAEVRPLRTALDTLAREVSGYRREGQDREERLFEALQRETIARAKLEHDLVQKMNTRRRVEAASLAAAVTLIVGLSQVFSSHSYAQAQVQVHEMNRIDRGAELEQLKAHDELLIKKTLDERQARIEGLVVRP